MIYDLSNAEERDRLLTRVLSDIENGKGAVEYKSRRNRSLNQNSYLHVLCAYFACEYGCSEDYAKREFYKKACNEELYKVTRVNYCGEPHTEWRSSASLTAEEMSLSIERFKNWSVSVGIRLPDADEHKFLLRCQQEIERNKQFL